MSEANPYHSPEVAPPGSIVAGRNALGVSPWVGFLLCYYGLAVYHGVQLALVRKPGLSEAMVPVLFWVYLCYWALNDARRRGQPIPYSQRIWFYVLAPVVVPGYVLGTRRWRGLGYLVLHLVAWYVVSTVAMLLAGWAYFGNAWWSTLAGQ